MYIWDCCTHNASFAGTFCICLGSHACIFAEDAYEAVGAIESYHPRKVLDLYAGILPQHPLGLLGPIEVKVIPERIVAQAGEEHPAVLRAYVEGIREVLEAYIPHVVLMDESLHLGKHPRI